MHILIMAQCFAPEDVSAGKLITELAQGLLGYDNRVSVVTGAPNYPYGRVFPGYRNSLLSSEWRDGVHVIRTWSYISPRQTFWARLFHYGTYSATAFYGALFGARPDLIVSFSPPLPLGLSAWALSRIWQVPWVLQLEDLYPDAALAAGVLRQSAPVRFLFAVEKFLYEKATHISLISDSFRRNLLDKGVPAAKISLIPVWADPDTITPLSKQNLFRRRWGLEGKFVVLYAGNLGLTSCVEDLLAAADQLGNHDSIRFVFVGEGVKRKSLEHEAARLRLQNVRFLDYQPAAALPEMMAAADLSVVTLNTESSLYSLPSKIFNIMASARPILAIAPSESEIAALVTSADCGLVIPPRNPSMIANRIEKLMEQSQELTQMGQNGRDCLIRHFSRKKCVHDFHSMLGDCLERHRKRFSCSIGNPIISREGPNPSPQKVEAT